MRILILTLLLASSAAVRAADAKKVTFDDHVLPIMKDKCAGCHNQDKKRAGLVVVNYTQLMAGGSSGAVVKPGDPDGSALYQLMAHAREPIMPPKSQKPTKEVL